MKRRDVATGWRRYVGLALVACCVLTARLAADPVDDLRQALPIDDKSDPTEAMLAFRRTNLKQKIDDLKTIRQLRRALALDEWRDDPTRVVDKEIRAIDTKMRTEVGERLAKILKDEAHSRSPDSRLAVANLVAEMGPAVRALSPDDKSGFTRSLTPLVIELTGDADVGVKQEALRALGNINAKAEEAAKVFEKVLTSEPAPGPRRVAADSLAQLVRVANALQRRTRSTTGVEATRAEMIDAIRVAIFTAPAGLPDPDPQVKTLTAGAFQVAIQALADLIPDPYSRKDFPPEGRELSPKEVENLVKTTAELKRDVDELRPLLLVLRDKTLKAVPLLEGNDRQYRLAGMEALMNIAVVRQRLRQRVYSLPRRGNVDVVKVDELDPLDPFLRTKLSTIAPLLRDSDPRLRQAAVSFLYLIEERALSLVPQLTRTLADPERTIRWIAAGAFKNLPGDKIGEAAPALGKLLSDPDLTLRVTAASALEAMGRDARAARADLARAITQGDSEGRIAALKALSVLAPEDIQTALPQLIEVLGQPDTETKVLVATCETLGQMGAVATPALPALRRLIGHEDSDVRTAASEAIVAINSQGKR